MTDEIQQDSQPGHVEARARRSLPRGLILLAVTALATVGFIAIALRVVEGHADAFDRWWALEIHRLLDSNVTDAVMITFTKIGDSPCLYGSTAIVSLLALRRRLWPLVIVLLANALFSLLINMALKYWFLRQRPTLFDEITRPATYSFPSGHAMSAMAVYGGLAAVLIGLYPKQRWIIVAAASVAIVNIGLSRVFLGVHWPLDVVAGWIAGVLFVVATVHIVHRLLARRKPD